MELSKVYEPQKIEEKIYSLWEKSGYFSPDKLPHRGKPYCIIMPPTNANGNLHIGHALVMSLEDLMIRYHRLKGEKTLWLPGTDHAGFETQVVYERQLEKKGKSRFDMTREEFYQAVFKFTQENRAQIKEQIKRLGASCDWSREKFTLDKDIIEIVYQTFEKLYRDGLLYRDERIVNYCPKHQTAFSDLEVNHITKQDKLYYVRYQLLDEEEYLTVATTRPETIPGDVALAVNPKDERYLTYVGKYVIEPILKKKIPVISDEAVDKDFGTGVLKITPAHDAIDFEIGKRHNLEIIKTLNFNGRFNDLAGPLSGLNINKAREKAIEILQADGALAKMEDYEHQVGVCYKCQTTIEPMLMKQWFIALTKPIPSFRGKSLRDLAYEAVKSGKIKIFPKRFEKVYFYWLKNLRDWNITRQIWWGINIPIWYCSEQKNEKCKKQNGVILSQKKLKRCPYCGSHKIYQDLDTFDTWFSSAQWPFATLKTQKKKKDFLTFYPTSVLETGYDILFFWVARMVMLGIYATLKVPFKNVYLHGLVRDKFKQKISKSKGNVIDPIEVVKQYGSDALRMGLIINNSPGNDLALSEEKVIGYRNFANKIWNASRYVLMNLDKKFIPQKINGSKNSKTSADYQVLVKLNHTIKAVTQLMDNYRFYQAGEVIYQFFWHDFCDKYIEISKNQLKDEKRKKETQNILYYVLKTSLILLHPFMPYITEEIWQCLPKTNRQPLLIIEKWPKA